MLYEELLFLVPYFFSKAQKKLPPFDICKKKQENMNHTVSHIQCEIAYQIYYVNFIVGDGRTIS